MAEQVRVPDDGAGGGEFFEARAFRHGGYGRFDHQPIVAALVARIRALSGGFVPPKGTVA
ncbi:hypothetical protein [Micromonospora aurantiaca (nom. illeg.)]|uniref:hypothetical protein n=1 Tax=Micromonospora aurantiaca (nom. illeg.) TaxID=47850 RepID=UPI0001BF3479|nr:hypothetical protein [Micromonospora aurantiaca]ADL44288.1 hypothetical protein Micau_0724 [Micromonospora aurantiaca ATCC 27029]